MRRRTLLLGALLAALPGLARAETLYVAETDDGHLNLRAGPGTGYGIVVRLTAGMEVAGLGASGIWRELALPDGTVGWASGRYLAPWFDQRRRYDYAVVRTSDGHLNLRAGPGTDFGIRRRLYAGQRLFALDRAGNWARVQLPDGTTGWASLAYLAPL